MVLQQQAQAFETYKQLLTYTKSAVTRNVSEKAINCILDYIGGGKGSAQTGSVDYEILDSFYEATRSALKEAKNDVRNTYVTRAYSLTGGLLLAVIGQDQPQTRKTLA